MDDFTEVLMEHPETKSLQYASDREQYNNMTALGWVEYKGNRSKFGPGKDVPWGSTTEAPSAANAESTDADFTPTGTTSSTTSTTADTDSSVTVTTESK